MKASLRNFDIVFIVHINVEDPCFSPHFYLLLRLQFQYHYIFQETTQLNVDSSFFKESILFFFACVMYSCK